MPYSRSGLCKVMRVNFYSPCQVDEVVKSLEHMCGNSSKREESIQVKADQRCISSSWLHRRLDTSLFFWGGDVEGILLDP